MGAALLLPLVTSLVPLVVVVLLCTCHRRTKQPQDNLSLKERALPAIPAQPPLRQDSNETSDTATTESTYAVVMKPAGPRPKSYNPKKSPAPLPPCRKSLPPLNGGAVGIGDPPPLSNGTIITIEIDSVAPSSSGEPAPSAVVVTVANAMAAPPPPRDDEDPVVAREAVAGNVPSVEIPYMTPPLALETPPPIEVVTPAEETTGPKEVPYTTISVREPLAKVRQQTLQMRQQVAQPEEPELENHYYMVPEEQMYCEISSRQEIVAAAAPPSPPTVESLKTVAQAHSRQASLTSTCSVGSATAAVPADLYSVVDKSAKKCSPSGPRLEDLYAKAQKPAGSAGPSLEDMYAKVKKKKSSTTTPTEVPVEMGDPEVFAPSPVPPSRISADLSAPGPSSYVPLSDTYSDPGYERVHQGSTDESEYEKTQTLDSDDPGYERIRKDEFPEEPPYERIQDLQAQRDEGSDPDYESVRPDSQLADPNYEIIHQADAGQQEDEEEDPCYESVHPAGGLAWDPDYETIQRLGSEDLYQVPSDLSEPGYERIRPSPPVPGNHPPAKLNGALPSSSPSAVTTVSL